VPARAALGGDPAGYVAGLHDAALAAAALAAVGAVATYALLVARGRRAAAPVPAPVAVGAAPAGIGEG
jgi:hypothetical protein